MIIALSHATAGVVWIALALLALWLGAGRRESLAFAVASGLQAGWALSAWAGWEAAWAPGIAFEAGRTVAWAVFFALLLPSDHSRLRRTVVAGGLGLVAIRAGVPVVDALAPVMRLQLALMTELVSVILALCMTVMVFRAAGESDRWSLKFLCFPLAGMFVYDLYIYGQALSIGLPSIIYLNARAILALFSAPFVLIAVWRSRVWTQGLSFSRQAALYSLVLVAVGIYLIVVAGATLLMEHAPIALTPAARIGLLFASAVLLVLFLASGTMRAKLKLLVSRHFFAGKYDYAHEWRKFMRTLAFEGQSSPLENRIIRACADLLEVPGGALWVMEDDRPRLQATWNYRPAASVADPETAAAFRDDDGRYDILNGGEALVRAGLAQPDEPAWLAVPLPHDGVLLGFLVLANPRARRPFDIEDRDLLLLIAYQCASYLAEKRTATALQQEKQFSRFSRQYAFVAHDIKNIVSQLSVMLKNFDRHADNPEFQRDMQETVSHAVERMRGLLDRLSRLQSGEGEASGTANDVEAVALIRQDLLQQGEDGDAPRLVASNEAAEARVRVDAGRLVDVLGHLTANAREAAGGGASIVINVDVAQDCLVIDVTDDGPGMTLEFVRDSLFTPFRSTKSGGFGVGVYQCREFAREHGGDLEAISSPGSGTTMRLRLPLAERKPKSRADGSDVERRDHAAAGC